MCDIALQKTGSKNGILPILGTDLVHCPVQFFQPVIFVHIEEIVLPDAIFLYPGSVDANLSQRRNAIPQPVENFAGSGRVLMLLPMHFAASIARNCSPITAVIVVSSGMGNVSPFDLVKRTAIPMAGAMLVNVGMTFFYYYRG